MRIGGHRLEFLGELTVTHLRDGKQVPAAPHVDDPEYEARARSLGYEGELAQVRMSREHEICHALLAKWMGLAESPVLRGVADGAHWKHWHAEECAVLALQKFANMAGVNLMEIARRNADRG